MGLNTEGNYHADIKVLLLYLLKVFGTIHSLQIKGPLMKYVQNGKYLSWPQKTTGRNWDRQLTYERHD